MEHSCIATDDIAACRACHHEPGHVETVGDRVRAIRETFDSIPDGDERRDRFSGVPKLLDYFERELGHTLEEPLSRTHALHQVKP